MSAPGITHLDWLGLAATLAVLTVADVDSAVAVANDSQYGLAASVWTRDVSLAHQVSRRLRAGTVWVNCYEEGDMTVPFGGYKQSCNGRDKSVHALKSTPSSRPRG